MELWACFGGMRLAIAASLASRGLQAIFTDFQNSTSWSLKRPTLHSMER